MLRKSPEIIVATPGRLIDHLRNSQSVGLEDLAVLVLDEADRWAVGGWAVGSWSVGRSEPGAGRLGWSNGGLACELVDGTGGRKMGPAVSGLQVYRLTSRLDPNPKPRWTRARCVVARTFGFRSLRSEV